MYTVFFVRLAALIFSIFSTFSICFRIFCIFYFPYIWPGRKVHIIWQMLWEIGANLRIYTSGLALRNRFWDQSPTNPYFQPPLLHLPRVQRDWKFLTWHFEQHFWFNCLILILSVNFLKPRFKHVLLFFWRFCSELDPESVIFGFLAENYIGHTNSRPNWCHGSPFHE